MKTLEKLEEDMDFHEFWYEECNENGDRELALFNLTWLEIYATEYAERTGYWKKRRTCEVLERILEKQ